MNDQIIKMIQDRLNLGSKKYGKENIASDGRDFVQEALEECLDLMVYVCARLIEIKKGKDKNG